MQTRKRKRSVLIVEHDAWVRVHLAGVLESTGATVSAASNGVTGLRLAVALQPDQLILGAQLPEPSSADLLAELRARPATRHIHVIALDDAIRSLRLAGEQLDQAAIELPRLPEVSCVVRPTRTGARRGRPRHAERAPV